jgi:hypothetical protein
MSSAVDPAHLKGWPKRLKAKTGLVTVPETEEPAVEAVLIFPQSSVEPAHSISARIRVIRGQTSPQN